MSGIARQVWTNPLRCTPSVTPLSQGSSCVPARESRRDVRTTLTLRQAQDRSMPTRFASTAAAGSPYTHPLLSLTIPDHKRQIPYLFQAHRIHHTGETNCKSVESLDARNPSTLVATGRRRLRQKDMPKGEMT
jgi:hypothetical protein